MVVGEPSSNSKWTEQEDVILRKAVSKYGAKSSWQQISACLSGRSNKSCRKRWIHSLDPTLRKGRWSASEDALLVGAVNELGTRWWEVARRIPGRTDDQCAKRWRENLNPSIIQSPWTPDEDRTLLDAHRAHGQRWNLIASLLPGRPAVHCRNRCKSLMRPGAVASTNYGPPTPSDVSTPASTVRSSSPGLEAESSETSSVSPHQLLLSPTLSSLPTAPPSPGPSSIMTTDVADLTHSAGLNDLVVYAATSEEPSEPLTWATRSSSFPPPSFFDPIIPLPVSDSSNPLLFDPSSTNGLGGRGPSLAWPPNDTSTASVSTGGMPSLDALPGDLFANPLMQGPFDVDMSSISAILSAEALPGSFAAPPLHTAAQDLPLHQAAPGSSGQVSPCNTPPPPPGFFVMTCPQLHCSFQAESLVEIWKHMTICHIIGEGHSI